MKRFTNNIYAVFVLSLVLSGCAHARAVENKEISLQPAPQVTAPVQATAVASTPAPQKPIAKAYVPSPDKVIEQLKAWDKNLQFLQTDFTQVTSYDGVEVSRSKGQLFYQQDKRLLRLDTKDNDGALIQSAVTDRNDLFILDDKSHVIMKLKWDEWQQNQPNQALFDFGNYTALLDRHNVKAVRPNHFALTPKSGNAYTLYLTLSAQDAFPTSIKLVADGVTTQADLIHTQKNSPLPDNTFGGKFK